MKIFCAISLLLLGGLTGCGEGKPDVPALPVTSPDLQNGQPIHNRHTGDGKDVSPELAWGNAPSGTQEWVVIVDDPDAPAGIWTHWVVYGLPADTKGLPRGSTEETLPKGSQQGRNGWSQFKWRGPAPPPREMLTATSSGSMP